jgi:hypothetical protein
MRCFVLGIAAMIVAAGTANVAGAHDLRGTIRVPPDAVVVEARFSDDTPAPGAMVSIRNGADEEVASGKTDQFGMCRLSPLPPGVYRAVIESIGHRDAITFEVADSSMGLTFANPRLNATLGLGLGVGILLAVSLGYRGWRGGGKRASAPG